MKRCSACRLEKARSDFHTDRTRKDGLYPRCKKCANRARKESRERTGDIAGKAARVAWRKRHPDRVRAIDRKVALKRYGLTPEAYDDLLAQQDGLCAICRREFEQRLAVDHDHGSGKVRGLLCTNCNLGLGKFFDDPDLLQAAMQYLEGK